MRVNIIRGILITLLVLIFSMIFNFSSQDGETSSGLSTKITIAVTQNVKRIQMLEESEKQQVLEKIEFIIRKLAHFSIYTLVGVLMMSLMSTYNIKGTNRIYISLIVGFIYACSDEFHQFFVPERSAMPTDVLIDTLGVSFGIALVLAVRKIYFMIKE